MKAHAIAVMRGHLAHPRNDNEGSPFADVSSRDRLFCAGRSIAEGNRTCVDSRTGRSRFVLGSVGSIDYVGSELGLFGFKR